MQQTRNDIAALLKAQEALEKPKSETELAEEWAVENGLIKGYSNGEMGWNDSMTRAQFATILYRYDKMKSGK
jgi:hypothetical protein